MKRTKLTQEELLRRRARLRELAASASDAALSDMDAPAGTRAAFALAETSGAEVYESFSDEELLDVLREASARLGHSPSQKEIFWVYRGYLKQRFGKWPYALQKAGLSKSAGSGGVSLEQAAQEQRYYDSLLQSVRDKAAELGRTPHPADLPEVCEALRKRFATWGELLTAAGVEYTRTVRRLDDLEPRYRDMLGALRARAAELGRPPLRSEVEDSLRVPLVKRCGSWRNTLYQIGLEPVTHITPFSTAFLAKAVDGGHRPHRSELSDCYYKVLNLNADALAALEEVRDAAKTLGHPPRRGEVRAALRKTLQTACGSWSNALFQIGLQPERRKPRAKKT